MSPKQRQPTRRGQPVKIAKQDRMLRQRQCTPKVPQDSPIVSADQDPRRFSSKIDDGGWNPAVFPLWHLSDNHDKLTMEWNYLSKIAPTDIDRQLSERCLSISTLFCVCAQNCQSLQLQCWIRIPMNTALEVLWTHFLMTSLHDAWLSLWRTVVSQTILLYYNIFENRIKPPISNFKSESSSSNSSKRQPWTTWIWLHNKVPRLRSLAS